MRRWPYFKRVIRLIVLMAVCMLIFTGCKIEEEIRVDVIGFNGMDISVIPYPLPDGNIFTVTCEKYLGLVDLTRIFEVPRVIIEPYQGADFLPLLMVVDTKNLTVMYYLDGSLIYGGTWLEAIIQQVLYQIE